MKYYTFFLLFICFPCIANAQTDSLATRGYKLYPAIEILRSTHSNLFYAPSLKANYLFENGLEPGVGIEYSTSRIHHDNGYILRKVHFLPIYANLKYNFNRNKRLNLYVETSVGHSFNQYHRATDKEPNKQRKIHEGGVYFYSGVGTKYAINKSTELFFAIGFKGYKFSRNNLDINPHGISFSLGFSLF
ncbi:hypothetical protein ACVWYG_000353 [Pedobacter sp. UYEF25]